MCHRLDHRGKCALGTRTEKGNSAGYEKLENPGATKPPYVLKSLEKHSRGEKTASRTNRARYCSTVLRGTTRLSDGPAVLDFEATPIGFWKLPQSRWISNSDSFWKLINLFIKYHAPSRKQTGRNVCSAASSSKPCTSRTIVSSHNLISSARTPICVHSTKSHIMKWNNTS